MTTSKTQLAVRLRRTASRTVKESPGWTSRGETTEYHHLRADDNSLGPGSEEIVDVVFIFVALSFFSLRRQPWGETRSFRVDV